MAAPSVSTTTRPGSALIVSAVAARQVALGVGVHGARDVCGEVVLARAAVDEARLHRLECDESRRGGVDAA